MLPSTILVVEDDLIIARGIEKRLKALGYRVAGPVATGEEAVRRAAELRPDMILMDINLGGGIDGVEAAALIRRRSDVPVVFLTAHSDDATLQRAKVTEPHGYVLKPYEDKDLFTAIEIGLYRHQINRRLRENERWLAATLDSIGDGVIATDERGHVRFMNPLAEHMTGWAQADAVGRDIREVFHIVGAKTRRPVTNPALEALATGEPTTLAPDTILIDRTGVERPIADSAAPIREVNDGITGSVLVFRDVSERCRLEENLRQAQRIEAIGMLAGGIAHDFNNILTVINGYGQLLLDVDLSEADRLDFVQNIVDAGKRAALLTQQIIAFSRKQILVPCVLSLNSVVRDIGAMIQRLIGENIEFVTDLAPDLGNTEADPTQIGQVLLNLAANARDAMPKGGRLAVVTSNVELDEKTIPQYADLKPGRYVLLSVTDTGCGMTDEVLGKVFEPFFTTKGVGQGAGLGLATVYGIVKQSGGHIEVSSRVGEGTTFRVFLALVDEPPAAAGNRDAQQAARGHETILLVEDEAAVRKMTSDVLRRNGYAVLEAADGLEAVAVAGEYAGPIHLVITDLIMPKMSGREVAEQLAHSKPGARILFMSGYTEDVVVREGVKTATVDFLGKPFTFADLTQKVREILDRPTGQ
ncbi:hybrid sensor histidine kinase/response regulator [Fimbriiglobus ruber]|uniref:histidine kinase n=1 Tax=Fimbriiglobus ruber TaxID=1908690 RepID=A0A225D7U4_9BACT|nr:hybrid sensor histidine kinase/response regulator [Fimbriiglobus ruber]OWK34618.1 sensory box histidine kinase/response regulator [Fimbriiglobus ruber]